MADGTHCLLLTAQGASFALRPPAEQAAFVAAFARFLNGLHEPVQILIRSDQISLETHAQHLDGAANTLAGGLRSAAADHAHYLRNLAGQTVGRFAAARSCSSSKPPSRSRSSPRSRSRVQPIKPPSCSSAPRCSSRATRRRASGRSPHARPRRSRTPYPDPTWKESFMRQRLQLRQPSGTRPRLPAGLSLLGPPVLELRTDCVRVGERWQQTFAVSGYPREVGYGWLAPLLRASSEIELSLHVRPFPAELAAQRLSKQRARFESTRQLERERGSLTDLAVAAAAEDAHQLADRLARGESRLFRAALYLTISAASKNSTSTRPRSACAPCARRSFLPVFPRASVPPRNWLSSLPLGLEERLCVLRVAPST